MVKSGSVVAGVFASSLLLGACASGPRLATSTGPPPVTRTGVQPGDQVIITFYTAAGAELTEVSGERVVDPNGEVFLPYLGAVRVIGLETAGIRKLLEERYGAIYARPVIEVVTKVNVNITGAVRQPGQFFILPSATLVDALAQAGGVTSEVDLSVGGGASDPARVRLVRDGVGSIIDMRPLAIRPDIINTRVQSGDWLFVPRAQRSLARERVTFWGGVLSTLFTAASLIVLIVR